MALRSMTGFGAAEGELSPRLRASVRVGSVNGRFLEVIVRSQPRLELTEIEPALRAAVAEQVNRGRVTIIVNLKADSQGGGVVSLNWGVAEEVARELKKRPHGLDLAPLSFRDLLGVPGFLEGGGEMALDEGERSGLVALVGRACAALADAREQEGRALRRQIESEIAALDTFVGWLRAHSAGIVETLLARLRQRIGQLVGEGNVSEERLLQEAAIAADRADVAEEITRLEAHLAHLRALLDEEGPVGKRLEFLLQEVLREVNTAASKCREVGMGERVVEAKAAVERLREQFANIE